MVAFFLPIGRHVRDRSQRAESGHRATGMRSDVTGKSVSDQLTPQMKSDRFALSMVQHHTTDACRRHLSKSHSGLGRRMGIANVIQQKWRRAIPDGVSAWRDATEQ
jgi:hypothetical protein